MIKVGIDRVHEDGPISSEVGEAFFQDLLTIFLYSEGVLPFSFLNSLLKEDLELKPAWYKISRMVTLGSEVIIRFFASSQR